MRSLFLIAAVMTLGSLTAPARAAENPHAKAVAALALASAVVPDSRPAPRPTGEVAPLPKPKSAKQRCECDGGGRCLCPGGCDCEPSSGAKKAQAPPPAKEVDGLVSDWKPAGATTPAHYPTIKYAGRWQRWDGWKWVDEGPADEVKVAYDCSSGVCRPVASSNAVYGSSNAVYGGSCASGSCGTPAAAYGGGYGSFGAGVMSGGGGCSGGSCGSSGGGFRRR